MRILRGKKSRKDLWKIQIQIFQTGVYEINRKLRELETKKNLKLFSTLERLYRHFTNVYLIFLIDERERQGKNIQIVIFA
jgi:hypothetical protein